MGIGDFIFVVSFLLGLVVAYNPADAEQRSRMASRAARSKPSRELVRVSRRRAGGSHTRRPSRRPRDRAAVANQLINTRLRAIEQERKIKEAEDLEARIEALEVKASLGQPMKGARQWQRRP